MMNENAFSVAMCVYNGDCAENVKLAIDSVLNQSLKPDEVVLVVDGPISQSLEEVVRQYEIMPFFKVVRLKENQGHGPARRTAMANCKNEIVALMDADDICVPTRFEEQMEQLKNDSEVAIVGSNIAEFIHSPENIVAYRNVPASDVQIKQYMKRRCPMNQMTVMFRKKDVDAVGGYLDWYCEEDYYLWLRMALANMKFVNIQENLVLVRVGEEMYRRRGGLRYFLSEAKLQKYMWDHKVIGFPIFMVNVAKRLVVQVLLPNRLRGWVFQKFARNEPTSSSLGGSK